MSAGHRAMVYMAGFAFFWAVVEALAAGILRDYSPYQVVFTRYVVHMLLMFAVWGWRDPASLLRTRRPLYQVARSMLMLVMPASWIMGMQHNVDGSAFMTIFWLSPLLILALAALFLRERAPLLVWLAAAVGYAGALIVLRPHLVVPQLNWIFPLGMAGSLSLYIVMTRSLRTDTTRANLFYSAMGVAVALVPVMFHVWRTPTPHDLAFMVGVGVLGYGALFCADHAAAAAPVGLSATFLFLQLPLFTGFERALGRAGFGRSGALGTTIILIGAGLLWAREPRLAIREGT